jgi:hypothetical protein
MACPGLCESVKQLEVTVDSIEVATFVSLALSHIITSKHVPH